MVQQNVSRAGRHDTETRTDNSRARKSRFDQARLEIFIEEFRDTHRVEADRVVNHFFTELVEFLADIHELEQIARLERSRVRRRSHQERSDGPALTHDVAVKTCCTAIASRSLCRAISRRATS